MTYYRFITNGMLATPDNVDDPSFAGQIEEVPDLTDADVINQYNLVLRIQRAMADNSWPDDLNIENMIRSGKLLYFPGGYITTDTTSDPVLT